MSQHVVIGSTDTTFSAVCKACGAAFAGRLDDDLDEGMFLCRFGHQIRIIRVGQSVETGEDTASAA